MEQNQVQTQTQAQAQPQQDNSEVPVTFSVTVGELNGIFGAINASAFQAVMQPLAQNVTNQVSAQKLPPQQTQQEALAMSVTVTLKLAEVNTIFSVVNSTGFATILKPVLDKITAEIQLFVSTLNNAQRPMEPLQTMPQMNYPPPSTDFGNQ